MQASATARISRTCGATMGTFTDNPMGIHWTGIVFGPGLGDLLRLLDHGFPGGAARDGGQGSALGQDGAHHRRGFQDVRAVHRDPARLAGPGRCCRNTACRPNADMPPSGGHSYNEVLPLMLARYCGPGPAGARHYRPDRRLHVRHGGQRQRLRHGLDLRHLPRLHRKNDLGRPLREHGPLVHHSGRARQHRHGLPGDAVQSIMDYVQALFSFFIAPLFGTVLLGMLWKRGTRRRASGVCWRARFPPSRCSSGSRTIPRHSATSRCRRTPSHMAENMYRALWSWFICAVVTVVVSLLTKPKPEAELTGLVYGRTVCPRKGISPFTNGPFSGPWRSL